MKPKVRSYLCLLVVCCFIAFSETAVTPVALAQSQQAQGCRDKLALVPAALFCEKYTNGYVLFKDSMLPPNTVYTSRGEMEIVVFDNFIIISREDGTHLVVPRDRIVYFGSEEIK